MAPPPGHMLLPKTQVFSLDALGVKKNMASQNGSDSAQHLGVCPPLPGVVRIL